MKTVYHIIRKKYKILNKYVYYKNYKHKSDEFHFTAKIIIVNKEFTVTTSVVIGNETV